MAITNKRKAEIFDEMLYYLVMVDGLWNTVDMLSKYGMTKAEILEAINVWYPELKKEVIDNGTRNS